MKSLPLDIKQQFEQSTVPDAENSLQLSQNNNDKKLHAN